MENTLPSLPFSCDKEQKWGFLNAYNIRTIRDIFVYCVFKIRISEKELYQYMDNNIIPPPKRKWVYPNSKVKDRLKLEYVHAARYLKLIKYENKYFYADLISHNIEKEIIISENLGREFLANSESPYLKENEIKALRKIVLDYKKAKEFLWWFLDWEKYPTIDSFEENDFKNDSKPILINSKIEPKKKAREIIIREIDSKKWRIPYQKPNDYTRLVTYILPQWFKELGLIDSVAIFPEYSFDGNTWIMYYPIRAGYNDINLEDLKKSIYDIFFNDLENKKIIWIPQLLYYLVRKYYCSLEDMKNLIIKLHNDNFSNFSLERASLQVMTYGSNIRKSRYNPNYYENSFIKLEGFYRSYIIIKKEGNNNEKN